MIKLLGVSLQCIGPPAKMTRSWKNAQTRVCIFPFCCDNFWYVDVGFLLSMQTPNEKVIVPTVRDGRGRFFLHRADWGKAKNLRDAARPGGKGSKYARLGMAGMGNILFISVD